MNEKVGKYKEGVHQLKEQMPQLMETYEEFTGNCFSEGQMSKKQKQLIALGISLFSNNEVCTFYHTEEAIHEGAAREEILETIGVAAALGGGHSLSQGVTRVQQALEQMQ